MDDGGAMRSIQRGRDLHGALERLFDGKGALRQPVRKRLAVQKLHDEIRNGPVPRRRTVGADVVKRADVRMTQSRDDAGFALETLTRGFVNRGVRQEHFDRDGPAKSCVVGPIHLAHAAAANAIAQAVRTELRARQVFVRPFADRRDAPGLEKVIGALVCIE